MRCKGGLYTKRLRPRIPNSPNQTYQPNIFPFESHGKVDTPSHKVEIPSKAPSVTKIGIRGYSESSRQHDFLVYKGAAVSRQIDPESFEWIIGMLECGIVTAGLGE
jgi:hypothetical protein